MVENQIPLLKSPIENGSMSSYQIIIVAICFILNFNDGIDVLIVSFSSSDIIKEWGLSKVEMGYIFSAALAGMTLGCFLLAPIADKIGRRKVFLWSIGLITIGMFGVAFGHNYALMLFFRFLTGLGIGGILPTMAATVAEFSNLKYRDFTVGLVQAGWPVGAILTGFFCAYILPTHGWHFAFLTAGCISFLMFILVYLFMSDSVEFLVKNKPANALEKVNILLKKMGRETYKILPDFNQIQEKSTVQSLFMPTYKDATIKVWIAAFFGFLTLYTLMSWVPTIAKEAGLPYQMATYVGIALNVGAAIGSASIGAIGSKFGLCRSQFSFMIIAFIIMNFYANMNLTTNVIFILIFLMGVFVQGGFNGIWPILSRIYPAQIRTTGVGFTVGIGRFGAIIGPTLFGYLVDIGLSTKVLFIIFSLPLLIMGFLVWKLKTKNL